jgi:hypothetical protein
MMTSGLFFKNFYPEDDHSDAVFSVAWHIAEREAISKKTRSMNLKKISIDRGYAIGENTPFAFCCFDYRRLDLESRRPIVRGQKQITSLGEAIEHIDRSVAQVSQLKHIMDHHTVDQRMYKIESKSGLYRLVPYARFAKWNEPQFVIAIDINGHQLAVFEPLVKSVSSAILDALEQVADLIAANDIPDHPF